MKRDAFFYSSLIMAFSAGFMNTSTFTVADGSYIRVTDFVSSVPSEIAAQNLGLTLEELVDLPQKEAYSVAEIFPDKMSFIVEARANKSDIKLASFNRYPLHSQHPRIVSKFIIMK